MANDKKSQLLGQNYSTAASALRKQIIFYLSQQLGITDCFRCGKPLDLQSFSIEHKESWMRSEDPVKAFFNECLTCKTLR